MKENIMKKIAILLLISSSLLIQNSFARYEPCMCELVMVRPNGQVVDCCGQLLHTYPHLAQTSVQEQVAEKALKTEECLQTCVDHSSGPVSPSVEQNKNRQKKLYKSCQSNLKSYLKKPTNTLDSWCKLQNSRPTAK